MQREYDIADIHWAMPGAGNKTMKNKYLPRAMGSRWDSAGLSRSIFDAENLWSKKNLPEEGL
jgi:hypothetical protein